MQIIRGCGGDIEFDKTVIISLYVTKKEVKLGM